MDRHHNKAGKNLLGQGGRGRGAPLGGWGYEKNKWHM